MRVMDVEDQRDKDHYSQRHIDQDLHRDSKSDTTVSSSDSEEEDDDDDQQEDSADIITPEEFFEDLQEIEDNIPDDLDPIHSGGVRPEEDVIATVLLRRSLSRQDSASATNAREDTASGREDGGGPREDKEDQDSDVFVDAETEFHMSQASITGWPTSAEMVHQNQSELYCHHQHQTTAGYSSSSSSEEVVVLRNAAEKRFLETVDSEEDGVQEEEEEEEEVGGRESLSSEVPLRYLQDDGRVYASGRSSWVTYLESVTENQVESMQEYKLRAILKSLNINKPDLWKREDLVDAVKRVWRELQKPEPRRNLSQVLTADGEDGGQDNNSAEGPGSLENSGVSRRHPSTSSLTSLSSLQGGVSLDAIQSEAEIGSLTTRNLKSILENYGVAVDALVVRQHFIAEVKKLWLKHKRLEERGLRLEVVATATRGPSTSSAASGPPSSSSPHQPAAEASPGPTSSSPPPGQTPSSPSKSRRPSRIPVAVTSPPRRPSDDPLLRSIKTEQDIQRMSTQSLTTLLQRQGLMVKPGESRKDLLLRANVVWTSQRQGGDSAKRK